MKGIAISKSDLFSVFHVYLLFVLTMSQALKLFKHVGLQGSWVTWHAFLAVKFECFDLWIRSPERTSSMPWFLDYPTHLLERNLWTGGWAFWKDAFHPHLAFWQAQTCCQRKNLKRQLRRRHSMRILPSPYEIWSIPVQVWWFE